MHKAILMAAILGIQFSVLSSPQFDESLGAKVAKQDATLLGAKGAQASQALFDAKEPILIAQADTGETPTPVPGAPVALTNAPSPQNVTDALQTVAAWLQANNPSLTNFYSDSELDFKLGGVYAQSKGEAGALIDVTDWGLIGKNIGFGGTIIEGNSGGRSATAALYAHLDYRRVIGNVAGELFVGMGFDVEQNRPMGIIGAEAEYRWSPHLGAFAGCGYGISGDTTSNRGIIAGGGFKYNF